jgi:RHS repeat-associated protein
MRRLVCSLLLAFNLLSAEEGDSAGSLVDYLKSPIPRVAGSVNVITGDWIDQAAHYEATGPDPYVVAHSYCSASLEEGTLADGWDFFHPSELEVFQRRGITYNTKAPSAANPELVEKEYHPGSVPPPEDELPWYRTDYSATLFYREAGGATVVFKTSHVPSGFHPELDDTGHTFVSSIDDPVRRDVSRTRIHWNASTDHWVVKLGDGTKRTYSRAEKHRYRPGPSQKQYYKRVYHIKEERLPSGNLRRYHYDKDYEIEHIETLSSDEKLLINTVHFNWHNDQVTVTTSEGRKTQFELKKLHDRETARVVKAVDRPGKARLSYEYTDKSEKHGRRLHTKKTSERPEVPKYYHTDKKSKQEKFIKDRVKEVWTKDFRGNSLALSHSFSYVRGDDRDRAEVREADGSTTMYSWWKSKRPHQVKMWDAKGKFLRRERFTWSEKKRDEGRLEHRTVFDDEKQPILDREYVYDDEGNVTHEYFRGTFTGYTDKRLSYDKNGDLKGGECLCRKATYSDDGRSLKTGEVDPLGNWTFYQYENNRELLTARFTCDQKHIIRREFFIYDAAAVCIKTISDDGSSRDRHDKKGVTRRTIRKIRTRDSLPRFGAPIEIQTFVWTPEGGKKLLGIERYKRNKQGLATAKEFLDTNGTVQKRWTYEYDDYDRLVKTYDPTGGFEKISYDDSGRIATRRTPEATTVLKYDLLDRPIEEKKLYPDGSSDSVCYQYDLTGRICTKIDGRGRATTTAKDLTGRNTRTDLPAIATEQGVVRPHTETRYDNLTEYHISPSGAISTIIRSAAGKPLRTITPGQGEVRNFYDSLNRLVEQRDPSGAVTFTSYDALNRPIRVEQVVNKESVSLVTTKYRGSDIIEELHPTKAVRYTYDDYGRRNSETVTDLITNQSVVARIEYDTLHRPNHIIHETLQTEEWITYDAADREIERRVVGSDGSLLSIATKAYDIAGRVIEEGVGRGGTIARTSTTYGEYGLPSSITYPDGTKTTIRYNRFCQWSDGHTYLHKVSTDARGVVTEQLLDANDQARLTLVRDPFGTIISKREVFFSVLGHPTRIDDAVISQGEVTSTITTRLEYNNVGQCMACTLAADTPDTAQWLYIYDELGRKIEEIKPSGTSLMYSYDIRGRLSTLKSSDETISWGYSYNDQNLPEAIEDFVAHGTTYRSYNGLGAMVSETLQTSMLMGYELLPGGLVSSIAYPDGTRAQYDYKFGRLTSVSRKNHVYRVNSRDLSGLITDVTLPDSCGHVTAAVDCMGRRTLTSHACFTEERTVFDPVSCCLERTIDGHHEVFTYDFLCQLTSDNGRSALYDSLHRRIETEGKKAVHNSRHQLLSQGDAKCSYDIDGRRIADNSYRYTYDALDRLVRAESDVVRFDYVYDPFNRRMSTTTLLNDQGEWKQVSCERYLWQGDCEVGAVDEKQSVRSLRVLGEGLGAEIGAAVLFELDGTTYIPLHDLSGHVRVVLTTDGQVAERLTYTAYGLESRTANITPWTFSSKRQDPTDFVYFGQRYYDPQTATWLTQDPLGTSAGPNLYAYVKNNPLTCFDLHGLFDLSDVGGWASDAIDTVCDAIGAVADFFCDAFSGLANSWSSGPTSGDSGSDWAASAAAKHCASDSSDRVQRVLDHAKKSSSASSGLTVEQRYLTQLLIYPYESLEAFFEAHKGENLGRTVFVEIPGAGTTLQESLERAEAFMGANKGVAAVVILYNSTQGLPNDLIEAALNNLGFELAVGSTLKDEFVDFLHGCQDNKIGFEADFICHSQGVAIGDNIMHSAGFGKGEPLREYCGRVLNLGGPKIVPGTINCMALGDPVSLLSLLNLPAVINAAWNGELRFVCPTRAEFPHNFSGTAYQRAVSDFMRERE